MQGVHILKLLYNSEKAAEQKKAPVQVPLYYEQAPQKKSLQSGQRSVLIMFRFILVTLCLPWMCIHIIPLLHEQAPGQVPLYYRQTPQ